MAGQKNDLQQWTSGGKVTLAVNGQGSLRLGNVVLLATIINGRVQLLARLPDGTTQLLAAADRNTGK
jgi:hypothetical protein